MSRIIHRIFSSFAIMLLIVLCFPRFAGADALRDLLQEGDRAYRDGNYEMAIEAYHKALDGGYTGGSLLYNLGNAYFKQGELGLAILYYERAKREQPHDKDIRYNLKLARAKCVDEIDAPPRLPIWNWLDGLRDLVSPRTLAWICWWSAFAASLAFAAWQLLRRESIKRTAKTVTLVIFAVFLLFSMFLTLRVVEDMRPPGAIILADQVVVRSAPDPRAGEVFYLHQGTHVKIIKELEGFREIALEDGRQGWLPRNACEDI